MGKRTPDIGIIAGHPFSPNMDAMLYNLGRLLSDEFSFDLVLGEDDHPTRLEKYYEIYKVPSFHIDPASLRYAISACRSYIKRKRPDILMNIGQSTLGLAVSLIGKRADISTIVRYPGEPQAAGLGNSSWERLKSRFTQGTLLSLAFKNADNILVIGEKPYHQFIKQGVLAEKIKVLPQPFDPDSFPPPSKDKKQIKSELGLQEDRKVILYVGRLSWWKGADRLLEIIEKIFHIGKECQFCLVGKGEYQNRLRDYPDRLVHLPGRVPHEQISPYYQASDMLLFPSRTEGGVTNVILEALATGLPIVASPVGDISHYVSHIASDTEEFIDFILQDELSRDPLPDYFDWNNQRKEYSQLFHSVIDD